VVLSVPEMLKAIGSGHAETINSLAEQGKIKPVEFATYNSEGNLNHHVANSVWAATDWLRENGFYNEHAGKFIWLLE
jgi:hypothetical protein